MSDAHPTDGAKAAPRTSLWDLARFFLRLGFTAFGGPAAHIALMEQEAVQRHRWLSSEAFLDLLGACNLIPGPSSTQVAMGIGYRQGGWIGLVLGGVCFILPASVMTLGIAWAYVRYGQLPRSQALLYGIKPVILAIVAQALWNLGRTAFRKRPLVLVAALAFGAGCLGMPPLAVLLGSGLVTLGAALARQARSPGSLGSLLVTAGAAPAWASTLTLGSLFAFFLKMGVMVFGSGYVLLAFLKADLVDRWHWLTQAQLLDAIAVGQVTPGPVFTTATFIGYLLKGWPGAVLATLGIFLPSFFMVGLLGLLLDRIRKSAVASAFLDGINAGALALMSLVSLALFRTAIVDLWTGLLILGAAVLLIRFKTNPTWIVLGGGLVGLLVQGLPW
jgi:chromate transporter